MSGGTGFMGAGSSSPSPVRTKRITVNLTEDAHTLLIEKAISEGMTMKAVASNAMFAFDEALKAEKMSRERIEQLKFGIKKTKQIAIIGGLVACLGAALLGFVLGVLM